MTTTENPTAGEGPVLLDIGGDVGALIVTMPEHTRGLEVEIRPAGATAAAHDHAQPHTHEHSHVHPHGDDHSHPHAAPHYPHVGVVERRTPEGTHLSLVYPDVVEGDYELCPLPSGRVAATATVVGGTVSRIDWPG